MNNEKREAIMKRLAAERPLPKSELDYSTPYELLVAVVLSAQATEKSVNLATAKLYPVANTPEGIIALGEEGLIPYIRTIGLYRNKAKNVISLSHQLLERFDGVVPRDRDALESLPGVGRKTANVVLNVAFGEATMPVDTHVFRVSNRTGLAKGKTPEEIEEKLLRYLPKAYLKDAHHWILLHGRYCCKASKPDCAHCPILDLCEFKDKTATKVKTED